MRSRPRVYQSDQPSQEPLDRHSRGVPRIGDDTEIPEGVDRSFHIRRPDVGSVVPIRLYCVLLLARKSQNLASIRVFEPVSDGDLTTDPGVDPRPGSDQGIIDRPVDREVAGLFPALEPKLRFPMGTTPEEELRMQVAEEETKRAGLDHP